MQIEINDIEIQEYANQRLKQLVDQKVKNRLAEIEWYKTIDHIIENVVREKVTTKMIETVIKDMDKNELVKMLSGSLADGIVDKLSEY